MELQKRCTQGTATWEESVTETSVANNHFNYRSMKVGVFTSTKTIINILSIIIISQRLSIYCCCINSRGYGSNRCRDSEKSPKVNDEDDVDDDDDHGSDYLNEWP